MATFLMEFCGTQLAQNKMMLVKLLDDLALDRSATGAKLKLHLSHGKLTVIEDGRYQQEIQALNQLKLINDGIVEAKDRLEVEGLVRCILPLCKVLNFNIDSEENDVVDDDEVKQFLLVLSLVIASDKINQLIKQDMTIELIKEIIGHYFQIVQVLQVLTSCHLPSSRLLSNCSFVSPLLISISFAFRLKYQKNDEMIKLLTVLFVYLLTNKHTLIELIKLFEMNSFTNMDVFEVFNKLWLKTLESDSINSEVNNLNEKHQVGPITIMNRLEIFKNAESLTFDLTNNILPLNMTSFLFHTSRKIVVLNNLLNELHLNNESINNCNILSELTRYLSIDSDTELLLVLITSLQMDEIFLKLHEMEEYNTTIGYFFFKFSHLSYKNEEFTRRTLSVDILKVIQTSNYSKYQVLFEFVDHNYKLDYINDSSNFQMLFSLQKSLFQINKNFRIQDELSALTELGSSYSIESLLNYTSYIIQSSLIKFVNPIYELPLKFSKTMELGKFPPLPKSEFLNFKIKDISKIQLNLKNFHRLIDSLQLSFQITNKVLINEKFHKSQLGLVDEFNINKNRNLIFHTSDVLLTQYFTVLFTNLIIATQLETKSKELPSIFYDFQSISNVLKLQSFKNFDGLFELYGSFGIFKLMKFIQEISLSDLNLQRLSIMLLNHLYFHSSNHENFQLELKSNNLILNPLIDYIKTWNDGSKLYSGFIELLDIVVTPVKTVTLEFQDYLKVLGFTDQTIQTHYHKNQLQNENIPVFSSTPSSSTSSLNSNFNMTSVTNNNNNFSSGNTTATTFNPQRNNSYNSYGTLNHNNNNSASYNFYTQSNNNYANNNPRNSSSETPINTMNQYGNYDTSSNFMNSQRGNNNNIRNIQSFIPHQFNHNNQNSLGGFENRSQQQPQFNVDQLYGK